MPWCEPCARYFTPSSVRGDGACPQCGTIVAVTDVNGRVTADSLRMRDLAEATDQRAPWHFTLMMFLLVAYLGWRIIAQLVD